MHVRNFCLLNTRWYIRSIALVIVLATASTSAQTRSEHPEIQPTSKDIDLFSEIAEETGIKFVHFNGMSGEFY